MSIDNLRPRPEFASQKKVMRSFETFSKLLNELDKKTLPEATVKEVNNVVTELNESQLEGKSWRKLLKKRQASLLKKLEKDHKIVSKGHYRNLWMALGMAVFGIPMGTAMGVGLDNMAFIGTGIPIGLVIGMAIGSGMDKKAQDEGRQLDLEIDL